jgi:hypothetical protein
MKKMWLSNWLQRNESWGLNQKWVTFKQYEWKSNAGLMKEPDGCLPWQLGIGVCECEIWALNPISERWIIIWWKLKTWSILRIKSKLYSENISEKQMWTYVRDLTDNDIGSRVV